MRQVLPQQGHRDEIRRQKETPLLDLSLRSLFAMHGLLQKKGDRGWPLLGYSVVLSWIGSGDFIFGVQDARNVFYHTKTWLLPSLHNNIFYRLDNRADSFLLGVLVFDKNSPAKHCFHLHDTDALLSSLSSTGGSAQRYGPQQDRGEQIS